MTDPLTCSDWDAAEEVDHVFQRIRTGFVAAENPRIGATLLRASEC